MSWEDLGQVPQALGCLSVRTLTERTPYHPDLIGRLGLKGIQFGSFNRMYPACLSVDLCRFVDGAGGSTVPGRVCLLDDRAYYLQQDATRPLPFADACFDWAYAEHFIEHIELRAAIAWLTEVRRILRPGGLVRITTPDLRRYVEGYLAADDAFFAEHRRRMRAIGLPPMETRRAWMVNQIFRFWGHRWIYDLEELRHVVTQAGFDPASFRERGYREGRDPEVCRFDQALRNDETLYVEATVTGTSADP